jgi:hypothetical protein
MEQLKLFGSSPQATDLVAVALPVVAAAADLSSQ